MTLGQIPIMIISEKTIVVFIAIILMFSGLALIYNIVRKELKKMDFYANNKLTSIKIKSEISYYIQNPKSNSEFRNSSFYNPFKDKSLESEYYFLKLSNKFSDLTCSELKTLIESTLNEHH